MLLLLQQPDVLTPKEEQDRQIGDGKERKGGVFGGSGGRTRSPAAATAEEQRTPAAALLRAAAMGFAGGALAASLRAESGGGGAGNSDGEAMVGGRMGRRWGEGGGSWVAYDGPAYKRPGGPTFTWIMPLLELVMTTLLRKLVEIPA